MPKGVILIALTLAIGAGLGCQPTPQPLEEQSASPTIVGWRLVERTYGETDPDRRMAGDGEIPGASRFLVFQPTVQEPRAREFGALQIRTSCTHEIQVRIQGSLTRTVGEQVTAECRLIGQEGLYHELQVAPSGGGTQVLGIRGIARAIGKPGRYLVPGGRVFEVDFTSVIPGRGTVEISVLREVGEDARNGSRESSALAAEER